MNSSRFPSGPLNSEGKPTYRRAVVLRPAEGGVPIVIDLKQPSIDGLQHIQDGGSPATVDPLQEN